MRFEKKANISRYRSEYIRQFAYSYAQLSESSGSGRDDGYERR